MPPAVVLRTDGSDQGRHVFSVRRAAPRGGGAASAVATAAAIAALGAATAAGPLAVKVLLATTSLLWLLAVATQTVEEAIEVLPGVGVVLRSRPRHGGGATTLLDAERIRAVIINEAVTTTTVQSYLAFVLHDSTELAVAFPTLLPRLDVLQPVYRGVSALLERPQNAMSRKTDQLL